MTVSVVIPTHNRAAMVAEAFRSVVAQTFRDVEIIVVDDGSTDDTERALAAAGFDARSRYLRQEHAGVAAARNRGVAASSGEWIAFLDSDDLWLPEKLARQAAFVAAHPAVAACQTDEIWIRDGVRVNPHRRHLKPSGDIFLRSLELCLVSPSAVLVRRTTFERAGGFDEGLAACEDYDLWLRIAVDTPVHLVREPLVVRRAGHADQLSRRYWGMDRFRVAALSRLVMTAPLDPERRVAALGVLARKCGILAAGARRRGRVAEAERYVALALLHTGAGGSEAPRRGEAPAASARTVALAGGGRYE
jgi:glycosyltransferase involved in cell wall biosynthesis